MEKILLITDVTPFKEYSGALLTYDILEQLPKETVSSESGIVIFKGL